MIRPALAAVLALALGAPAHAWEPETNAGLTDRAARASGLHQRLAKAHGRRLGLYEPLAVPPADAPTLARKLAALDPTVGGVPDGRGRQSALAWIVAGALLEESPGSRSRHHFLDPIRKTGLTARTVGTVRGLAAKAATLLSGGGVPWSGKRADEWLVAPENDLGLARFWTELEASVVAGPAAQRERHLAYALVCAGALAAVLEDLGSPSRVRDDLAAHLMPLGGGAGDLGSRTERIAALAFGRLGSTTPTPAPARATWREFFTAADGKGLADVVHARAFSIGTLPPSVAAAAPASERAASLAGVVPAIPPEKLANVPPGEAGARVDDAAGRCVAQVHDVAGQLEWILPDDCVVEQLGALLPLSSGYAAGLLDWLFRGALDVTPAGAITAPSDLGAGRLTLFVDDAEGVRRRLGDPRDVAGARAGDELARTGIPAGSVRLVALFRGKDARGDELVAVGQAAIGVLP